MSVSTINFTITTAGLQALINATNTGLDLKLTHIQLGSGNKTPDKSETALIAPQQIQPITVGSRPAPTQIRMTVVFPITASFKISEIGIWAGMPGQATSVLFAYWSNPSGDLMTTVPGVDFVFTHDMTVDSSIASNVEILIDPNSGLLAAHIGADDPHPQYVKLTDFGFNTNGYHKLPSGLIIQCGLATLPKNNQNAVSAPLVFPVAFPKKVSSIVMTNSNHASNAGFLAMPFSKDVTNSGFTVVVDTNDASWITIDQNVYWVALGY